MPAKDMYHDTAKRALVKDSWTITHDPLTLSFGRTNIYVDLGAERLFAAENQQRKIAVEVKSFRGPSEVDDLEKAIGQYILYQHILADDEPDRVLYLGIPQEAYEGIFSERGVHSLLTRQNIKLIVFDKVQEVVLQWI